MTSDVPMNYHHRSADSFALSFTYFELFPLIYVRGCSFEDAFSCRGWELLCIGRTKITIIHSPFFPNDALGFWVKMKIRVPDELLVYPSSRIFGKDSKWPLSR